MFNVVIVTIHLH